MELARPASIIITHNRYINCMILRRYATLLQTLFIYHASYLYNPHLPYAQFIKSVHTATPHCTHGYLEKQTLISPPLCLFMQAVIQCTYHRLLKQECIGTSSFMHKQVLANRKTKQNTGMNFNQIGSKLTCWFMVCLNERYAKMLYKPLCYTVDW